jgi:hypothetical protein
MTAGLLAICLISAAGLCLVGISQWRSKDARRSSILTLLIAGVGGALAIAQHNSLSQGVTTRGSQPADFGAVIVLYFCMVLGMLAQCGFRRFERPTDSSGWREFLAPIFASPIVFIPLLGVVQNTDLDLRSLAAARYVIFFVAFENGFFWKDYFDHRNAKRGSRKH